MPTNETDVFPLTVTVPESFEDKAIMEVIDTLASVQAAYVERESVYEVPETWRSACGFYILFSPISKDGSYNVYVGKSDKDFTKRLRSHDQNKEGWVTALLVQRVSVGGLSSTQSSYLEGALRDIFDRVSHVTCHNIAKTGDWTLPDHEKLLMKQIIDSTLRIMLLRGYRTILSKKKPLSQSVALPQGTPVVPPRITMSVPVASKSPALKAESAPEATSSPTPISVPEPKKSMFSLFGKKKDSSKSPPTTEEILEELIEWRRVTALEGKLRHSFVVEMYTLKALAERMPKTYEELLTIPGIKEVKREKYGQSILKTLDRLRS